MLPRAHSHTCRGRPPHKGSSIRGPRWRGGKQKTPIPARSWVSGDPWVVGPVGCDDAIPRSMWHSGSSGCGGTLGGPHAPTAASCRPQEAKTCFSFVRPPPPGAHSSTPGVWRVVHGRNPCCSTTCAAPSAPSSKRAHCSARAVYPPRIPNALVGAVGHWCRALLSARPRSFVGVALSALARFLVFSVDRPRLEARAARKARPPPSVARKARPLLPRCSERYAPRCPEDAPHSPA